MKLKITVLVIVLKRIRFIGLFICVSCALLNGCASAGVTKASTLCDIYTEEKKWYRYAKKAEKRWGVRASTLMAFVNQESSFKGRAKPPRKKLLGLIPWKRPSSAYGYAQATDGAWSDYKKSTGRIFVSRSDMKDSLDFIGWYNHQSHKRLGIPKSNTHALYLAYHEGHTGYKRKTYRKKPWLARIADKVTNIANRYESEYGSCS